MFSNSNLTNLAIDSVGPAALDEAGGGPAGAGVENPALGFEQKLVMTIKLCLNYLDRHSKMIFYKSREQGAAREPYGQCSWPGCLVARKSRGLAKGPLVHPVLRKPAAPAGAGALGRWEFSSDHARPIIRTPSCSGPQPTAVTGFDSLIFARAGLL